jgi:hypothetical protein
VYETILIFLKQLAGAFLAYYGSFFIEGKDASDFKLAILVRAGMVNFGNII